MMTTRREAAKRGVSRNAPVRESPPKTPTKSQKGQSPSRSPGRPRKSSPATRRSPARRSPGRASKFPARKSPSRIAKVREATPPRPKSPSRRIPIKFEKEKDDSKPVKRQSRSTRATDFSVRDYSSLPRVQISTSDIINGYDSKDSNTKEYSLRRRNLPIEVKQTTVETSSSRIKKFIEDVNEIRKSFTKSPSKSSDVIICEDDNSEDEIPRNKSKSLSRKLATPLPDINISGPRFSGRWEFGGRIGTSILIILLPSIIFALLISCNKACSYKIDLKALQTIQFWFSQKSAFIFTAQIILQAVLACIPFLGKTASKMDDSGKLYCYNGLFASFVTIGVVYGLDFAKILPLKEILPEYFRLAVLSYMFATALAVFLHIKTRKSENDELNPYGNTGYTIYDFCLGREILPEIFKVNIKIWLSRICNITGLILTVIYFSQGLNLPIEKLESANSTNYKEILQHVTVKPTILTISLMQLVYFLYFIVKESKVAASFYWQSEGVGYLQTVSSLLYPYFFCTISKYVAEGNVELSTNVLIGISLLYVVGFLILTHANGVKYEFRKNPLQPSVTHLEVMPTFHGKRLIISGAWGTVRHPNYTGDILIHLALAIPGILTFPSLAFVPAITGIAVLIHRAFRDQARCQRRYGSAWQRYCSKVPKLFIPKVI